MLANSKLSIHHLRGFIPKDLIHTTSNGYQVASSESTRHQAPTTPTTNRQNTPNVVLIDAVRTPFVQSNGVFKDMWAVDLQRAALVGITLKILYLIFNVAALA